ncbi:5-dehydro-4-deoxy-D-glucuronate isomerase [Aquimarina algiphila]|uniref:5-dehydro-4-deoxy-D-glucuronate isomerase n=1 Tax=Aquimarina algiphila TaxID=2047982 RepID=UPI00232FCDA3|nr:5-dehydro-4-deoxy-D-glucuronate isomerase [Aquimarina algiphila]
MNNTIYETRYANGPASVKHYDTKALRDEFLIHNLMQSDTIIWVYTHYDRYMAGSAVPIKKSLTLEAIDPLKAKNFLDRRELGAINVGGPGSINVDGTTYSLGYKDALYIGKDSKNVVFNSDDANNPARFYLNSAPAHHAFPTKSVTKEQAKKLELGAMETANARTVYQMILSGVVETCQLQMGMTELKPGSVWNTMPAHVHDRRMEIYFYFEIPEEQAVCHFMGPVNETRHIWMQNHQAVISPPWSIHSGSGTSNYTFIWGMAGENLDYSDMDTAKITELK